MPVKLIVYWSKAALRGGLCYFTNTTVFLLVMYSPLLSLKRKVNSAVSGIFFQEGTVQLD